MIGMERQVITEWLKGKAAKKIGKQFSLSVNDVYSIVDKYGVGNRTVDMVRQNRGTAKECARCKALTSNQSMTSGYCRECYTTVEEEKKFKGNLKRYGLSSKDYQRMLSNQQAACKICGDVVPLVIDHDHNTLKVRGLLCPRCNTGLGMFRDSEIFLLNAASYINLNSRREADNTVETDSNVDVQWFERSEAVNSKL